MLPLHMAWALPSTVHRTWHGGSVPPWVQTGMGAAVLGRCLITHHSSRGKARAAGAVTHLPCPGGSAWTGASCLAGLGSQSAVSLLRAGNLVRSQRAARFQPDSKNSPPPPRVSHACNLFPVFSCNGDAMAKLRGWGGSLHPSSI